MSKYLYEVSPKIPIKGIIDGDAIRREMLIELEKEQVLHCLKHGAVSRKFLNQGLTVKVTLDNIDLLHVATYGEPVVGVDLGVVENTITPVVVDETIDVVTEPVVEIVDDTTNTEETTVSEDVKEEDVAEVVDENETTVSDEDTTVKEVEEVVVEQSKNPKNNNNNKKK